MNPKSRILAVDDNEVNLEILEELLGGAYDLRLSACGADVERIALEFRPDLILLDVMLPDINGCEVCRGLRRHEALRYTKIVMVSARAMTSDRLKGYEVGADDYVTKPFDNDELLAKVRVFLKLKSVEEIDRLKTDTISLLCHGARTSLHGTIGTTELLMSEEDMETAERRELAGLAHSSVRRLQVFVEQVMTLSALKSGKWEFKFADANFCDIVTEAISDVARKASERELQIEVHFASYPITAIDEEEMGRCVVALIDNAVNFSPVGGKITVTVSNDNGESCLTVMDQGEGIPPEFLPLVFEGITCPDLKHHGGGHGLSLALLREVVHAHNGTVSVESVRGCGSSFKLRLPGVAWSEDGPRSKCYDVSELLALTYPSAEKAL